jgi:hypothetical protein
VLCSARARSAMGDLAMGIKSFKKEMTEEGAGG